MSTIVPASEQPSVSADLEYWLEELGRQGWLVHLFGGDHQGPDLMAATWRWADCADVIVIVDEQTATAYRTPHCADVFAPEQVTWVCAGPVGGTLRDLLNLPSPEDDPYRVRAMTSPPDCGVPVEMRRVTRILSSRYLVRR